MPGRKPHLLKAALFAAVVLSAMLWAALIETSPARAQVIGEKVYALQGAVSPATDRPFGHYFDTVDGVRYGLAGKTPEVELELTSAAHLQSDEPMKIWGELHPRGGSDPPVIIVTTVLAPRPPSPTPTPAPTEVIAIVMDNSAWLRSGPGGVYPAVRRMERGEACDALGRNAPKTVWIGVQCVRDSARGWLRRDLIRIVGDVSALPVTPPPPTPTPSPTPTATYTPSPTPTPRPTPTPTPPQPKRNEWRAEYTNTVNLSGRTIVDRIEHRDVNYPLDRQWFGSPAPGVRAQNWSARWTGPFYFDAGDYVFNANFNGGGVRVYIDGIQVLGAWNKDTGSISNTFLGIGPGIHTIRIEHPNRSTRGRLRVWWYKQSRNRDE